MFFKSKEKKLQQYLDHAANEWSVFDELLADYQNGSFKDFFAAQGLTKIDIHIDLSEAYKCIGLQARLNKDYVDLQIEPDEFGIAIDPDEPDIENSFELRSKEYVYETCKEYIKNYQR